jgi:porin
MFGRAGIADGGNGNPSFAAWFTQIGIGGNSPLQNRRRKGDRFGLGYIYTATSSEWGPIPTALLGPRDSQVLEAYYRYHWTPSIQISPDVQWVRGTLGGLTQGDDAFVFGFRMNMAL